MSVRIVNCGAFRLTLDESYSPYWQVRADAAPRPPLFKSTRETNETLALRKAKEIYAKWANEDRLKPSDQILFRDLWSEVLAEHATFSKPATVTRMESVGRLHLLPTFGNRFLTEIKAHWPAFVRSQRARRAGTNLFNERKYMIAALTYAYEHDLIDKVPHLQSVKVASEEVRVFTDEEINALLRGTANDPELRLFVMFGYLMGMRAGEIARIELEEIDLEQRTLHVRITKTSTPRKIGLNPGLFDELLAQVCRVRGRSRFLFPQVFNASRHKDQRVFDKAWQQLKLDVGVEGRFHDLRHTCANRLKQSNVPPAVAAAYLGMSIRVFDSTYGRLGEHDTKPAAHVVRIPSPTVEAVDFAVDEVPSARK